jgi:hypothetical protein
MARHLRTLQPVLDDGHALEARCFRDKRIGPRGFYTDHGSLIRDALTWRSAWEVYVGVGTRRCPDGVPIARCPHKSPGAKDHVGRVPAAWVEIDLGKPYTTIAEIIAALDDARLEPDLCVATGGGLHAYFLLDEPTTDFGALEAVNRGLMRAVGKDAAIDASRVLRLAGTINYKYDPPREAWIIDPKEHDADLA